MSTDDLTPIHAFETIKTAFNRWRADNASHISRDEAIRYALGEWLMQKGYLPSSRHRTLPSMEPLRKARASTPATYAASDPGPAQPLTPVVRPDR